MADEEKQRSWKVAREGVADSDVPQADPSSDASAGDTGSIAACSVISADQRRAARRHNRMVAEPTSTTPRIRNRYPKIKPTTFAVTTNTATHRGHAIPRHAPTAMLNCAMPTAVEWRMTTVRRTREVPDRAKHKCAGERNQEEAATGGRQPTCPSRLQRSSLHGVVLLELHSTPDRTSPVRIQKCSACVLDRRRKTTRSSASGSAGGLSPVRYGSCGVLMPGAAGRRPRRPAISDR